MLRHPWLSAFLPVVSILTPLCAQESAAWRDPSPHRVQFVTVDTNVKLEVLDWGGSGQPVVLLAGLGNTAHIFDEFAPKLTAEYHVYGITRRGYGASSSPPSGYSADRLGDDVLSVLNSLKLNQPVLVAHSIGGEELSSVGTRHPERVAGLIYLDAAYPYAYYDRSNGDLYVDLQELQKKLDQLRPGKDPSDPGPLVRDLLQDTLPRFEKDLLEMQKDLQNPQLAYRPPAPPTPTSADEASFQNAMPEGELRQLHKTTPEGHVVGSLTANPAISQAILEGQEKYSDIRVPVLAIFAMPHDLGPYSHGDPSARAASDARELVAVGRFAEAFERGVPSARVVRLPNANHFIFLTNEADVLREIRAFLAGLK
jgi:non-heme chloroperoxidase